MFRRARKAKTGGGPTLYDRVAESGCRRIAVLGLHRGSGARTLIRYLAAAFRQAESGCGVAASPREAPAADDPSQAAFRVVLPEGTLVAAASQRDAEEGSAPLETVELTRAVGAAGPISIRRVVADGPVDLRAPQEPAALGDLLARLGDLVGGTALALGSWEHRAFAAPGLADGWILAVGPAGFDSPERSAAAAAYAAASMDVPECDHAGREAWRDAAREGRTRLLAAGGDVVAEFPTGAAESLPDTIWQERDLARVIVGGTLDDALLVPLVRVKQHCPILVRDFTRVHVAPVYREAWLRCGGTFQVVYPARPLAVTTSPINLTGPDPEPELFRAMVAERLPDLPVHDVVLESGAPSD